MFASEGFVFKMGFSLKRKRAILCPFSNKIYVVYAVSTTTVTVAVSPI